MRLITLIAIALAAMLMACEPADDASGDQTSADATRHVLTTARAQRQLPPPAVAVYRQASATPSPLPSASVTSSPTASPTIAITATPAISPTPTQITDVLRGDHFWLTRPFTATDGIRDYVEPAYPYGTTALGYQPHHGADIPNPHGTIVRATADGRVFFAGNDLDEVAFGPRTNFYGNFVVLEHELEVPDLPGVFLTFYTLYGHMSEIYVQPGDLVPRFQEIGAVGQTGAAIGPHVHVEVRIGDPYDYDNTYNPNLWMQPWPGYGVLAGRVVLRDGDYLPDVEVEVTARESRRVWATLTYHYDRVNADPWFRENFVVPDLPEGRYEVVVKYAGRYAYRTTVDIESDKTTLINALID